MAKYRKRPVIIEAIEWTGQNYVEARQFTRPDLNPGVFSTQDISSDPTRVQLKIKTLEGVMTAEPGDYIIKGVNGEFYPCKPDIFEKTYEAVVE